MLFANSMPRFKGKGFLPSQGPLILWESLVTTATIAILFSIGVTKNPAGEPCTGFIEKIENNPEHGAL